MASNKRARSSTDEEDSENGSSECDGSESESTDHESKTSDNECSDDSMKSRTDKEGSSDTDEDLINLETSLKSGKADSSLTDEDLIHLETSLKSCKADSSLTDEDLIDLETSLKTGKADSSLTDEDLINLETSLKSGKVDSSLKDRDLINLESSLKSSTENCDTIKAEVTPDIKQHVKSDVKLDANDGVPANTVNANSPVKSCKELKRDLRALLKLLSNNSGDFATGGLLPDSEIPNRPLIEVNGFGLLPFPLIETTFECLKPLCNQSPYGMGEETLIDTSVRNSFQLEPSQFKIGNNKFVKQVNNLIQGKIKSALGLAGAKIYGKIYKLLIYGNGGKFDEHRDTEKEDNMFGTLIVQLPSVFTGGNLVVKHLKTSRVFENSSSGSNTHCKFVAHYASCPHELQEVTSGYRAALIYSLCWEGNGMKPSPYIASTNAVRLCNTLNLLMESTKVPFLCWGLEYEYSDKSLEQKSGPLTFFKGKDKNVVAGLKNAIDHDRQISGKDKWEMCIATANKRIDECGECHGGWDGCRGDCDFEENDRSFDIDDFVPLIANSSVCNGLSKFDIDPPKDIINFPRRKIIPGQPKRRKRNDSDVEFWGTDDLGEGCSGPSGNEGATRDRWYQKKVLLLWRTDCSLAFRCLSNMNDGISHVLSLLEKGEILEGEEGFKYLWHNRDKINSDDSFAKVLRMCHILNRKEELVTLLKTSHMLKRGITSERIGKVIAKTASLFPNDSIVNEIKEIMKRTNESNISTLVQFCRDLSSIEPDVIIQILVNDVLKEHTQQHTGYYSYYYGLGSNEDRNTPYATTVLKFMFENNIFPDSELDKLTSKMGNLTNLLSAITLTIDNHNVKVLNLLVMRFVELASKIKKPAQMQYMNRNSSQADDIAVAKIAKILVEAPQKCQKLAESVSTVINIIASMPRNQQQSLIGPFVKEIRLQHNSNKDKLPECLQKACLLQIEFLKETVSKGEPKLNWHQPNASVPGHPDVETFFKGPNKSMLFGRNSFKSITEARRWASNHAKDKGCYMTLTPSGCGRNAVVSIIKTTEFFDKQVAAFKTCAKEYLNLLKFLPKVHSVIPLGKEQRSFVNLVDKENQGDGPKPKEQPASQNQKSPGVGSRALNRPLQSTPLRQIVPESSGNKSHKPVDVITID